MRTTRLATLFILIAVFACGGCATFRGGPGALPPTEWGHFVSRLGREPGQFYCPRNLALDADGRLFVLDGHNRRVQVFDAHGVFLASWELEGHLGSGIAVDGAGHVVITKFNGELEVYDRHGVELARWGGEGQEPGRFRNPDEIVVDPESGRFFVDDRNNNRIQVLDGEGRPLTFWKQFDMAGMAVGPGGCLFITDAKQRRVARLSPSGEVEAAWRLDNGDSDKPIQPGALAVADDGSFVVIDRATRQILSHDAHGNLQHRWGGFGDGPGQFFAPNGIALDAEGRVYVSDGSINHRVQVFSMRGELLRTMGKDASLCDGFSEVFGVAVGRDGTVYVTDAHRIKVFTPDGRQIGCWGGLGDKRGSFQSPRGIVAVDDQIYVADAANNCVQVLSVEGEPLQVWERHFRRPNGMARDPDGNILLVDSGRSRVRRLGPDGGWLGSVVVAGGARGVTADDQGNIYVTSDRDDRVYKYGADGKELLSWGGNGDGPGQFEWPTGIGCGPDGMVYVLDRQSERLQRFTPEGEYRGQWSPAQEDPTDRMHPWALAFWGDNILIADGYHRRILRRPLASLFAD